MQLLQSHTSSMSVSQTARGDTPNDARHGSDDEESHNGTSRNSGYVVHSADVHPTMSEAAVRSTGMHSRPVQTGPICTTPGTCSCKLEFDPWVLPYITYLWVCASRGVNDFWN